MNLEGGSGTDCATECSGDIALLPNSLWPENVKYSRRYGEPWQVWRPGTQKNGIIWPGAIHHARCLPAPGGPASCGGGGGGGRTDGCAFSPLAFPPLPSVLGTGWGERLVCFFPRGSIFLTPSHSLSQTEGGSGKKPTWSTCRRTGPALCQVGAVPVSPMSERQGSVAGAGGE